MAALGGYRSFVRRLFERPRVCLSFSVFPCTRPAGTRRAGFVNARESPEPEHRLAHMFRHDEGGREVLNIRDGGRGEDRS